MHLSNATATALSASVALVVLAGCSGGPEFPGALGAAPGAASSSAAARLVQARQFANPDAVGKPLIFASNSLGSAHHSVVDIYLQGSSNKMVGQITGLYGPRGMATDKTDNVYIESEGDSEVFVYAPPYTGAPVLTLNDSGWFPYDVAVSPQGVVGVANLCSAPSCGNGSVTLYAKGATKPCATIVDPNLSGAQDLGFDDKGNLYIDGSGPAPSYGSIFGEIEGGCNATKITLLTTGNTILYPSGIKVDKADRIAILDVGNKALYTYNPPNNGSFGSPVSTVPLSGFNELYAFTFRASGRDVYVGASTSSGYRVAEFSYPGGAPKKAFNAGGGDGVAVTPPLTP